MCLICKETQNSGVLSRFVCIGLMGVSHQVSDTHVSLIFRIVIPTSFNILMEMFLLQKFPIESKRRGIPRQLGACANSVYQALSPPYIFNLVKTEKSLPPPLYIAIHLA